MALHANMNRDSRRKPNPYKPKDFYPYKQDERKKAKFVRALSPEEKELTAVWADNLQSSYGTASK